ncbi:site-specific integrase [Mycetocola saprophilus]|uniref:site-specific integrase n=1 Tax=Mycetocola saprophilus TaxID=76636 RepID=UPI0004C1C060|nr:tyrosine-type recombinase/integrase [Mycetocola saprophilus]
MARPTLALGTYGNITTKQVDGHWVADARIRDMDGKSRRVTRSGSTKARAVNSLKEAFRDRLAPTGTELSRTSRVSALSKMWWSEYTEQLHAPGTLRRYEQVLATHVVIPLGDLRLSEVTPARVDRHLKSLTRSAGYSSAEIAKVLLTAMFKMAARLDAIDFNPVAAAAPIVSPRREITAFTLEDVAWLRTHLREWDRGKDKAGRIRTTDLADPVDMFLATGGRPGEIFAIDWTRIEFEGSSTRAVIDQTMAKDRRGKWVIQPHTKANKKLRVTLPRFASEMLLRRRIDSYGALVFPSSTGTPRIPDNFRTQWHAALLGTRFEGRLPKEFRATVATALRDSVGIQAAQHQLGHSHLDTTERHYAVPVTDAPDVSSVLEQFNV